MGGIRTARQVASRVQKYNEKLKKIGQLRRNVNDNLHYSEHHINRATLTA